MFYYTQERRMQSLDALSAAVHQSPDLPRQKLEETIDRHIVGIHLNNGSAQYSAGTGFQITSDGFIVTACHVIAPVLQEWERINAENYESFREWLVLRGKQFVKRDGAKYPVDTATFLHDAESDVAVIKAVVPVSYIDTNSRLLKSVNAKPPRPTPFRIKQGDLKLGDYVRLHAGFDTLNYGEVIREAETHEVIFDSERRDVEVFISTAYARPGLSGGIFTSGGEVAGVLTGGVPKTYALLALGQKHAAAGIHAHKMAELVEKAVEKWRTEYQ